MEDINLRCLNPNGMISSYSALPLIFQFIPTKIDPIQVRKQHFRTINYD